MTRVQANLNFAFLCAVWLAGGWHPLARTFSLALHNDEYTHLFLILPLSAGLILLDWRSQKPVVKPNFRIASALLFGAVLMAGLAKWRLVGAPDDVQLSLSMLALVLWWIASFVACFGTRASRTLLFPLVFLLWMVPIPLFALNKVVEFLQAESAVAARLMFSLISVPVSHQGFVLAIPGVNIEVARECSSIRSSVMLLVASMVLAQVSLRSPWFKAAVIAATLPLSIAKNALRIVTLSILGTRVDPGFLTGRLYDDNMADFFFSQLSMPAPDVNLEVGSGSHAQQTAEVMRRFEPIVQERKPDMVVVYGDVNSTMAATLVCAKLQVPVAHVEAGLRSFDRTMPEEVNRLVTDQIADLLFSHCEDANINLQREGVSPEKIHKVGNVMIDSLIRFLPLTERHKVNGLPERFALVTLHRPSNVDDPSVLT